MSIIDRISTDVMNAILGRTSEHTEPRHARAPGRHRLAPSSRRLAEAAIEPTATRQTTHVPEEIEVDPRGIGYDLLDEVTQRKIADRVFGTLDADDLRELGIEPSGEITLFYPAWVDREA